MKNNKIQAVIVGLKIVSSGQVGTKKAYKLEDGTILVGESFSENELNFWTQRGFVFKEDKRES